MFRFFTVQLSCHKRVKGTSYIQFKYDPADKLPRIVGTDGTSCADGTEQCMKCTAFLISKFCNEDFSNEPVIIPKFD